MSLAQIRVATAIKRKRHLTDEKRLCSPDNGNTGTVLIDQGQYHEKVVVTRVSPTVMLVSSQALLALHRHS